ncbi:MAG TPA: alpha/beta fold hydrolase [Chondromyces sp.]|nr:alpha/beta fold hydrolase [Chondromyces sp.]
MSIQIVEKEVTIKSNPALNGTFAVPKGRLERIPAVLIIGGTGKIDRNGKVNKKLNLRLYRQLAEVLTGFGVATLRYDKRGVGASEGDYLVTGLWDLVEDAQAAVHFLKKQPEVDPEKVIVLGHSEGSTIGTAVAARETLAGLILLSGAGERISDALKRQRDLAREDILKADGFLGAFLRLIGTQNKIEKQAQQYTEKVIGSTKEKMRIGLVPTNAKWIREHFAYNVLEDLKQVTCPILAITGERDIQADPEALEHLPAIIEGDVEYYIVKNMGHSCKFQERTSTMFSVKRDMIKEANLPLHPELVELLRGWILHRYITF